MVNKNTIPPALLLALLTAGSCAKDLSDLQPSAPQLVVEGWIEDGAHPVVMLSTTVPVSTQSQDIATLADHMVRWAKVTISDGESEVILTGGYDSRYMPPYIYTSTSMTGRQGKTYTLTVSSGDYHASATTTIPETVPIDSLTLRPIAGNDTTRLLYLHFSEPQDRKDYYCLFYKIGTEAQQFTKCSMGVFDDNSVGGNVAYPVYKASNINTNGKSTPRFKVGERAYVKLATTDSLSYNFWTDFQNAADLSGNFFMPYTQNVRSNISGGLGYWCGYGASISVIDIR